VLAEAVQELWPGTQVTIGPVIENGFYYDFARNEPFTPEDLAGRSRRRCARSSRATSPSPRKSGTREEAKGLPRQGRDVQGRTGRRDPRGPGHQDLHQGDWFDLCRGPHMTSTGKIGNAFKLMKVAGAYWRGDSNNPMLTRIYGTAWAKQEELDAYLHMLEEAEKRDHRRLGREMDLFHFQEEGPGVVFWHAKGWTMFQELIAYMRRRLAKGDYQEVNAPQILDKSLWETSGHWGWYRRTCSRRSRPAGRRRRGRARLRAQADELPRPCADLQARAEVLSRPAAAAGRIRQCAPLRAVGRAARPDARARLHAGRRAHLLHRRADGGECLKINDLILSTYKPTSASRRSW
jgi:threonyl-tRNA synthetase